MKRSNMLFSVRMVTLAFLFAVLSSFSFTVSATEQDDRDSVLQIHVTTGEEEGNIPLSGIILDLYKTDLAIIPPDGNVPEADLARYRSRSNLAVTLMTDKLGNAEVKQGLSDGIYLVTEQPNPAMAGELTPFYIALDGTSQCLYLQKIPEKSPQLVMDIQTIQQKSGTFDMDQSHTWIIRSQIPAGIATAEEFTVVDTLDPRLFHIRDGIRICLWSVSDSTIMLDEGIHYAVTTQTFQSTGGPTESVTVSLLPEGLTYAGEFLKEKGNGELRIFLQTAISSSAPLGIAIPNDAHLTYRNSAGVIYQADSDIPEVHTGGIHIRKIKENGQPLPGAEYMIAREATQAEMEQESVTKEILQVGKDTLAVVYMDFYQNDLQGDKSFTAVTGADGIACIYGLAYGNYFLVESKPADERSAGSQPVRVRIDAESHLTETDKLVDSTGRIVDNTIELSTIRYRFPNTGGLGTVGIKAAGVLLICAAGILLLDNRRRRI